MAEKLNRSLIQFDNSFIQNSLTFVELSDKEFCFEFRFIIFVIELTALSGTLLLSTDWTIVCNKFKRLWKGTSWPNGR